MSSTQPGGVDPESAAEAGLALADMLDVMANGCPDGWAERRGATRAAVLASAHVPPLNRVMAVRPECEPADVAALAARIAAAGLPYMVETAPPAAAVESWCRDTGLVPSPTLPLMVCRTDDVRAPEAGAGVVVTRLRPDQMAEHAEVAATGFGAPREHFAVLDHSTMLDHPRVAAVVATVDGAPAATGLSVVAGVWVGVFVVGTVPAHRRRGLGALVTAVLVQDAAGTHGVRRGLLQSSDLGRGVYAGLGFRTLEDWTRWTVAQAAAPPA